ncbi:hypothetical protein DL767_000069 [Monosporascus sp. MG133]|nr:hypothetical protein DL767_000069 [Monosporascus sp. MG133]
MASSSSSIPVTDPFSWLRGTYRGSAYVSYSELSDHPACSFDFGHKGYAASCNYGGELLQMTAPSKKHGIVFARGDFQYSLYLSLARGQRERGGKSTFGLKLESSSGPDDAVSPSHEIEALVEPISNTSLQSGARLYLGSMVERGCYNYRWPFNQYSLCVNRSLVQKDGEANITPRKSDNVGEKNDHVEKKRKPIEIGTCSLLSFVKDGVLYQVLRLDYECHHSAKTCGKAEDSTELILRIDGPMRSTETVELEGLWHIKHASANSFELAAGKPLEAGREFRWRVSLSEFDIESGNYKGIELAKRKDGKEGHYSKDWGERSPVYEAHLKGNGTKASRIFIASFRLCEAARAPEGVGACVITETPSPDDISEFIGIGPHNVLATAAMWQPIFYERQAKIECISELFEVDLIARCLEKILDVDLVPATFRTVTRASPPLAPVSNLFLNANVDLKSLFWKTRFLVKVDRLLSRTIKSSRYETVRFQDQHEYDKKPPPSDADSSPITPMLATVQRIRHAIEGIMAYLVGALLEPRDGEPILMPETWGFGESNYYYVMVTIWYVVKHYPRVKWAWQDELQKCGINWDRGILGRPDRLPSRRSNPLPSDKNAQAITKDKDSLLKWFHYESVSSLHTKAQYGSIIPAAWKADNSKLQQLRSAAIIALVKRISLAQPYRAEDEIVDRLAFLAEELWPEVEETKTIMKRVTKRIENREFTRMINAGQLPQGEGGSGGPWEVHALCHHSRLVVAYRKLCRTNDPEISLTPCWERNNSAARRGFLRSEATAVLASTILDIFQNDLEYARNHTNTQTHVEQCLGPAHACGSHGSSKIYFEGSMSRVGFNTGEPVNVQVLLALQLETLEQLARTRGLERYIDYLNFQPPQKYHPDEFFESLDDTPELYKEPRIEETPVPEGIRRVLSKGGFHEDRIKSLPRETHGTLGKKKFPYGALQRLFNVTRRAWSKGHFEAEDTKQIPKCFEDLKGKVFGDNIRQLLHATEHAIEHCEFRHVNIDIKTLKDIYESQRQLVIVDVKAPDPLPASKPGGIDNVVKQLADSLVDQEVRHRLLIAPGGLQPDLLRIFVYVLHREMVDCFENHVQRVSRFVLQKRKTSVVAYITLRSWSLKSTSHSSEDDNCAYGEDEDVTPLPEMLKETLTNRNGGKPFEMPEVKLKVSSIGISTNEFGDFSKCSVITDLVDSNDEAKKLEGTVKDTVKDIWDKFIHQPQTGRFLVFSFILGLICEKIVLHYDKAIKEIVRISGFDNPSPAYLKDSDWLHGKIAEKELQLSLWTLEALYKLSNTMAGSIRTIDHAKADLNGEIEHVSYRIA